MERYEDFCLRSLATLQEERTLRKTRCEALLFTKAQSVIYFYGRPVLSPLLSPQQRSEMCGYRQRAVQLELDWKGRPRNKLLAQNQSLLNQSQVETRSSKQDDKVQASPVAKVSGYTLITDSPGLCKDPAFVAKENGSVLRSEASTTPGAGGDETVEKLDGSEDEEDSEDISLDSLLKRSREYVKREQKGLKDVPTNTKTVSPEVVCMRVKKGDPGKNNGIEFGFSLHHSPVGAPQVHTDSSFDSSLLPSPSKLDQNTYMESTINPCSYRRKPRPLSAGNIHMTFPVLPADLVPRNPVGSRDDACWSERGDYSLTGLSPSSLCGMMEKDGNKDGHCQMAHCDTNAESRGKCPVSAMVPNSSSYLDHVVAGFRRRSHTLDSRLNSQRDGVEHIDRSQERVPRFMAGVVRIPPSRRSTTTPLSQTYLPDNHSPSLPKQNVSPDGVTFRPKREDFHGSNCGIKTSSTLTNSSNKTDEVQWQVLEEMQRRVEEERALKMSLLLIEQQRQKEQQCPHVLLEEAQRRLREQGFVKPVSEDACGWKCRHGGAVCPIISPSCPGLSPIKSPCERSPGSSLDFPSSFSSGGTSPAQPPVYFWGSGGAVYQSRDKHSLILTSKQQRGVYRIGAIVRGFLIRRLLATEKIKQLRQTIKDTQEFIRSFHSDSDQKKSNYSAQDLSLQERVRAQLRAALYDIHDMFFEMPPQDRLALLQQERDLRAERKLRELEKTKCSKERLSVSAATQRSLDRKKRVGESPAQTRKMAPKQKSPAPNKVQKTSQNQNSTLHGPLNRQGSWYKKTPEEKVRRSDNLKKQQSLG